MRPDDFDWVKARFECSANIVFAQLEDEVKSDVDIVNSLPEQRIQFGFVPGDKGNEFKVVALSGDPRHIAFSLADKKIVVKGNREGMATLAATLTINDEGKCCLKVNGHERSRWQFRRSALESLFFETV